jgi:putative endonuclease
LSVLPLVDTRIGWPLYSSLRAKRSNPELGNKLDCFVAAASPHTPRNDAEGWLMKHPAVYIMANRRNGTLDAGVTSDLPRRAYEHRVGTIPGFSKRYDCKLLVWYELHGTMYDAITREKQIKGGSRKKKLELIEGMNPGWRDLYDDLA